MQSSLIANGSVSGSNSGSSTGTSAVGQLPTVIKLSTETMATDTEPMTALMGEQLLDNYQVIDLSNDEFTSESCLADQLFINTALLACSEILKAEYSRLQSSERKHQHFKIDQIKHDDYLVSFYTGFPSFAIFLEFFQFDKLQYWGSKPNA